MSDELARELLRATLDSTADGILVVDIDGRWNTYNSKFLAMWRIPPELADRGDPRPAFQFAAEQLVDPAAFYARVKELCAHPDEESHDILAFKDGRMFERYSQALRIGGRAIGRVWSFRDVTETILAERNAERQYAASQEAVRLRDEFLSIASHELRTPVTALQLALQGMQMLFADEEQPSRAVVQRQLDSTQRQAQRLGQLVGALLDVSRIQVERLELHLEQIDLAELVRDAAASVREVMAGAGCALTVEAARRIEGLWDRQRLEQVVVNLLSNAAKYAARQPVRIAVAAEGRWARITVEDHGTGIPPERRQQLFERFARAASARHYGGLGLGLFIVRSIVEAHGGRVSVDSQSGVGSTFTVELPLA